MQVRCAKQTGTTINFLVIRNLITLEKFKVFNLDKLLLFWTQTIIFTFIAFIDRSVNNKRPMGLDALLI